MSLKYVDMIKGTFGIIGLGKMGGNLALQAIAMMRHGFGGHPFGEDQGIKHEREFGKLGIFLKEMNKILVIRIIQSKVNSENN
jgi:hypothetical protein